MTDYMKIELLKIAIDLVKSSGKEMNAENIKYYWCSCWAATHLPGFN
jgi:hypothetical protein